jgi:hypothetical protein
VIWFTGRGLLAMLAALFLALAGLVFIATGGETQAARDAITGLAIPGGLLALLLGLSMLGRRK